MRPMPAPELTDRLNKQIGNEFSASQQYVAMAVHYDAQTLPQLAGFFYRQAVEERNHAMMLVQYLLDSGGEPRIPEVPAPRSDYSDVVEPVGVALEQERTVTGQIGELMRAAREAFQEISALQVTVEMVCDESFGQSISDANYTFRHIRIVKKRGRYTFTFSQRTSRGARLVTIRGVIAGDIVAGTLRVDERRRAGTLDGFGSLNRRGKVRCTTDAEPFQLPLVPGDLLAPSDAELEDGSLP